ncbi:hypothetical protein [Labedaea rhizosphaerae]|uniref:Methionine synthase n=1 Tax=Labedaea rhizosphaerae TaxID=598644 RepID=A0A4V3CZM8_LABRH|nr:hypothetical protein [Labedaea rhizosphaerae]TDQ00391.1 hypothetical protein EV186_102252 [Labedaea rhizosphaerae]
MTTTDPREGLFIGSISPAATTDTAEAVEIFLNAARPPAGPFPLPAVPLGETDDANWVDAQLGSLDKVPALRRIKRSTFGKTGNYTGIPMYVRRRGQHIDPDDLDLRMVTRVEAGYPVLREVAARHDLPVPRLQLGVNTLDLAIFGLRTGVRSELDAFVEATRRETHAAWERTGGNMFFLVETPVATIMANMFRGRQSLLNWLATALDKVVGALPTGASWGFHFCYGDLSNSSIGDHGTLAERLRLYKLIYHPAYSVKMINTVLRLVADKGRAPELVQVPLALGKRPPSLDPADYRAYREMFVPEGTKVFGGAIHYERSTEELIRLFHTLDDVFGQRVGMSNSCGFGRHDAAQMQACLDHMGPVAHS